MTIFTPEQRTYLSKDLKVTGNAISFAEEFFKLGAVDRGIEVLRDAKVPDDVLNDIHTLATEALAQAKVAQVPQVPQPMATPFRTTPPVATFGPLNQLIGRIEALLSWNGKLGKVAQRYHKDPSLWPTVDAFGRPFYTLEQVASMTKAEARSTLTGSGFPKCSLDSLMYYIQEQEGCDAHTLMQLQLDAHAKGVTFDPSQAPVTIKAGEWRWYNGKMGSEARYARPDQHEATCRAQLVAPVQYLALKAATKPQVTAAPLPVPVAAKAPRKRSAKFPGQA